MNAQEALRAERISKLCGELYAYARRRNADHFSYCDACMAASDAIRQGHSPYRAWEIGRGEIDKHLPPNVVRFPGRVTA